MSVTISGCMHVLTGRVKINFSARVSHTLTWRVWAFIAAMNLYSYLSNTGAACTGEPVASLRRAAEPNTPL